MINTATYGFRKEKHFLGNLGLLEFLVEIASIIQIFPSDSKGQIIMDDFEKSK